jgi:ribosome-associated translation inhibitor RaiA
MEVEINLDKKGKFRVEITVKTSHKIYRSEEVSESAETSVDIAIGELKMQIVKDKEKVGTLKERGRRSLKKKMVLDKSARF